MNFQLTLIILPVLLGSILSFCIGKKIPKLAGVIATGATLLSFLATIKAVMAGPEIEEKLFTWFAIGETVIDMTFRMDHLSAVMCLVVTGVGTLIHLYSIGYMSEDSSKHRFFSYLNLFLFSMLLLVLGGNLLVMFIGWEGVGLCSYLLIGFWYKNLSFASAGRKAFVVNRIGDAGMLIAIFLLLQHFGTIDFAQLLAIPDMLAVAGTGVITTIAICLFIGATGKSAQIPLFVWLPDAMAGPTPVSALIHAATMVTAGVYLLCRLHPIFSASPEAQAIILIVAVLTAFVAGTTALTQFDIKKVLAYSTVSQLGFMFMAAAAGAYWVAIFHVVTHAFFKACLFLGAGSVIHGCHHEQDMRKMGGLRKFMPITFITYFVSTIAIAGLAPLSGYYSKHAIVAALSNLENSVLTSWLGMFAEWIVPLVNLTAFITAFYMTRSLMMTFFGEYKGEAHPHESPWTMSAPLAVLAILAAGFGVMYGETLFHYLEHTLPVSGHYHSESIMSALLHSWIGISGVVLAVLFYTVLSGLPGKIAGALSPITKLLSGKYFFDEIYQVGIVAPLAGIARMLWKSIDERVVDASVNGTASLVDLSGEIIRSLQTGQVRTYMIFMFGSAVAIFSLYLMF